MLGLLARVPSVVFLVLALLVGAWWMQASGTPPSAIGAFFVPKVVLLIELAMVLALPAAGIAAVLAVVYLIGHHHEGAAAAGISAGVLVMLKVLWVVWLGTWVMGHIG